MLRTTVLPSAKLTDALAVSDPHHPHLGALYAKCRKLMLRFVVYLRHPIGVRYSECGFLALGDREVITANRLLLRIRGTTGSPPMHKLQCVKALWIDYDLMGYSDSVDAIFNELEKRRRPCVSFLRYRPGYSPGEHRDLSRRD